MKVRLYLDEGSMDQALVQALKARGVDVESALTCRMIGRADEEHLRFATEQERLLFSFNVADYCRLHTKWHAEGVLHAGIVVGQQQTLALGEQLRRLLRLVNETAAAELKGRLLFLSSLPG